jgi:hypothetical protein
VPHPFVPSQFDSSSRLHLETDSFVSICDAGSLRFRVSARSALKSLPFVFLSSVALNWNPLTPDRKLPTLDLPIFIVFTA